MSPDGLWGEADLQTGAADNGGGGQLQWGAGKSHKKHTLTWAGIVSSRDSCKEEEEEGARSRSRSRSRSRRASLGRDKAMCQCSLPEAAAPLHGQKPSTAEVPRGSSTVQRSLEEGNRAAPLRLSEVSWLFCPAHSGTLPWLLVALILPPDFPWTLRVTQVLRFLVYC